MIGVVTLVFATLLSMAAPPASAASWKRCKIVNLGNGYAPFALRTSCTKARRVARKIGENPPSDITSTFSVLGFRCTGAYVGETDLRYKCRKGTRRVRVDYTFV